MNVFHSSKHINISPVHVSTLKYAPVVIDSTSNAVIAYAIYTIRLFIRIILISG